MVLRSAPRPIQGLPGPSGPQSEKSPKRVLLGRAPKVPKECASESQRVRKESKSQVLASFRTLLRLRGALFGHFWGPAPGYSFRTLFGLLRGSGPEGPGRPCVGRGRSQRWSRNRTGENKTADPRRLEWTLFVGTSVDTFVGRFVVAFVGSPSRAENRENQTSWRLSWTHSSGPLVGQISLSPALCVAQPNHCPCPPHRSSLAKCAGLLQTFLGCSVVTAKWPPEVKAELLAPFWVDL